MRFILHLVLSVFFITPLSAQEVPVWVKQLPADTASVKYYRGWGEGTTKSEALKAASEDAKMQALASFGVKVEASFESYQNIHKTEISAVSSEKSEANLVDFNRKDSFSRKEGKVWETYVLFSYPKSEIEKEKKRLELLRKNGKKTEKSVVGSDRSKGVLIVDTKGIRAPLYIDGRSFGYTPVELIGQLSAGNHVIRIDDPAYETFEHTVVIVPNKTVSLPVNLKNAFGFITFRTNKKKSEIFLNDKKIGNIPLINYKVPAGKEMVFEIRNPETERSFQSVTLDKNEEREINVSLYEKKAKISVYSFPQSDAYILLDGRKTGLKTPLENYTVSPGDHKITTYKDGFEEKTLKFNVKGGENKKLSLTMLKMKKETAKKLLFDKAHTFTLFPSYSSKFPSLAGVGVEEKLRRLIQWNGAFPFLKARVSFNDKNSQFIVTVYIDEAEYKKHYSAPMIAALSEFMSGDAKEDTLSLECFEGKMCGLPRLKTDSDVYLRLSPFKHFFWSDKAEYMRFPIMHTLSAGELNQTQEMEVYFSAFNKNGKSVATGVFDFSIRNGHMNGKNIVFSPELLKSGKKCIRKNLLQQQSAYLCGMETITFATSMKQASFAAIDKIFIAVGVKAR